MIAKLPAVLCVKQGELEGDRVEITTIPFRIGRAPECELSLDVAGISRLHAQINQAFQQYTLTDLKSTNGTFVNGQRIVGEVPLRHEDEINLASVFVAMFEDPSATAQLNLAQLSISGGLYINEERKAVWIGGQLLDPPLAPRQYSLLEMLSHNEGQVVSREEVAAAVWPDQTGITDQMIDALVFRLRKRLEEYGAAHYLVTRRGFGLMFVRDP